MEEQNRDERPAAKPIRPTPEQERRTQIERDLQETLQTADRSEKKNKKIQKILWIGVPLAAVGLFIAAISLGGFEPSSTAGYSQAKAACERAVETKLLSPSSAKVTTLKYAQHKEIPENWMISGEVRAQNAFGAELTRPWRCFYEEGQPLVFID